MADFDAATYLDEIIIILPIIIIIIIIYLFIYLRQLAADTAHTINTTTQKIYRNKI